MASDDEKKECPFCAEEMDSTDQQFKPCPCGYQVCSFCWHKMMEKKNESEEAICPHCRAVYDKEKIMAMQAEIESQISNRKARPAKAKPKANEVKKDLTRVRVIQLKIVHVTGLPFCLANEDLLQGKEYFGQYGEITKLSFYQTAGGDTVLFDNGTCSVYVEYSKEEEAVICIQSVHGFDLNNNLLGASFGINTYCHAWLKKKFCNYSDCRYLHTLATDEYTLDKDDVTAVETRSREICGTANIRLGERSGSMLPPPVAHDSSSMGDRPSGSSGPPPNQE